MNTLRPFILTVAVSLLSTAALAQVPDPDLGPADPADGVDAGVVDPIDAGPPDPGDLGPAGEEDQGVEEVEETCLESLGLPIRLCGVRPAEMEDMQRMLLLSEHTWRLAVETLGFARPLRPAAAEGFEAGLEINLRRDPSEGVTFENLGEVAETEVSDCGGRIWLNPEFNPFAVQVNLVHEILMAVHVAEDCGESMSEFFAMYLELLVLERAGLGSVQENLRWVNAHMLSVFQTHPHFALDMVYDSMVELSSYHLGQSLFAMYLDQRFGQGDGALLAALAAVARQPGKVRLRGRYVEFTEGENEPDLYDALDLVLADQGSDFWSAVEEFSIWRFFTGSFADSEHLRWARSITGVEVNARLGLADLPVQGVLSERPPRETGSVYLNLDFGETGAEPSYDRLLFELSSAGGEAWYVAALVFDGEGAYRIVDAQLEGGAGTLAVDQLGGVQHVVIVVTAKGDGLHDPDDEDWDPIYFEYGLRMVHQPQIDSVSPDSLEPGTQGAAVVVEGRGFDTGLQVELGADLDLRSQVADAEGHKLVLVVDVASGAEAGWRPLALRNELGMTARLDQGLRVGHGAHAELLRMDPASAAPGQRIFARVWGQGLPAAPQVRFEPAGVTVLRVDALDSQELVLELALDEDATLGPRDLLLGSLGQVRLAGAFEIKAAVQSPAPSSEPADDKGCTLAGAGSAPRLLPLLLALGALLALRRREAGR